MFVSTSRIALLVLVFVCVCLFAKQIDNLPVSVFSSKVQEDKSKGIYPIGGSGQINGHFCTDTYVDKDIGIQVGLRVEKRYKGPVYTLIERSYYAEVGVDKNNFPLWDLDFHLDAGTAYLATQQNDSIMTPHNALEHEVTLSFDLDPSSGIKWKNETLNDYYQGLLILGQNALPMNFSPFFINPNVRQAFSLVSTMYKRKPSRVYWCHVYC